MRHGTRMILLSAVPVLIASALLGQPATSSLTGTVTSDGKPLSAVTVTASSPALLGTRTTLTGESGDYYFAALPPGRYDVRFERRGMQTLTRRAELHLAMTTRANGDIKVSEEEESVTTTASAESVLETPEISTNIEAPTIDQLPAGRTITDRVTLAPGVQTSGPNGQLVINGAPSFDNLYLLNGAVLNDNLRGQPHAAVIEDAIDETTIVGGGASAEYGRFTGGVISTITKSGGNDFSGSFRDNLSSDSWTSNTPIEASDHTDAINSVFEGTLGGRIIRDRVWFFAAGRQQETSGTDQTAAPAGIEPIQFTTKIDQRRYEGKLTGNAADRHTFIASYLKADDSRTNVKFGNIVDLASLVTRSDPLKLWAGHYIGAITSNLTVEALYSQKDYAIVGGGAAARDVVNGTLLRDRATGWRGWSPTFCGVCPPKERNNKDWSAKGSYFLSTRSLGSHTIVTGYDEFHELRNENNYQSGSDWRFFGDFIFANGKLYIHADPKNDPGSANAHSRWEWDPLLGLSRTSDFATKSIFANDKWNLSTRWSFTAGLRYDRSDGENQSKVKTVSGSRISPRLGAIYDIGGNGRQRVSLSYGRYAAKVDQGPADQTSGGGRYATYLFDYRGPEINPIGTPANELVPTEVVLQQVFAWLDANGGRNLNNPLVFSASVPGLNVKIVSPLKSPFMDELTAGYGLQIGGNGYLRGDLIHRKWGDFYVLRRDLNSGKTADGKLDVGLIENGNSGLERNYNGLELQGSYKFLGLLTAGGNYTFSKLRGNVEGEEFNNATVAVGLIQAGGNEAYETPNYPEYTNFKQNHPVGYLGADIRHRANLWLQFDVPVPFGQLNVAALERYHSGQSFSAAQPINPTGITNPGYAKPPSAVQYYFSDRGAYRLNAITESNLNVTYTLPIHRASLFVKGDVLNIFNEQGIENVESTTSTSGPVIEKGVTVLKSFNPYSDKPVECPMGTARADCTAMGANFQRNANWGNATNKDAYQLPRTYRVAVGVRF